MSLSKQNYSFYAIPVFWAMGMMAHLHGVGLQREANKGYFHQINPKGTAWKEELRKNMSKDKLERMERAYAAHYNSFENLAIFCSAIVMGNAARLPTEVLNKFALKFLALRAAYTLLYINVSSNGGSYIRLPIFMWSVISSFRMIARAGKVLSVPTVV